MFFKSKSKNLEIPVVDPVKPAAGAAQPPAQPATSSSGANEKAVGGPPPVSPAHASTGSQESTEKARRRATIAIRKSIAFTQIVGLLSRSPTHKFFTLADLEWLVMPPLLTGQFAVAEAKPKADGPSVPVAAVFWASVSAEVDKRLSENLQSPIRLKPEEWGSGEILWLIDALGDPRMMTGLLKRLCDDRLKGRDVKMRGNNGQGQAVVASLRDVLAKAGAQSEPKG